MYLNVLCIPVRSVETTVKRFKNKIAEIII